MCGDLVIILHPKGLNMAVCNMPVFRKSALSFQIFVCFCVCCVADVDSGSRLFDCRPSIT